MAIAKNRLYRHRQLNMRLRSSLTAFIAAFFAMLSIAAVPQGMMPTWGANGFSIQLCDSARGEMQIKRSDPRFETLRLIEQAKRIAQGELPDGHNSEPAEKHCSFAGSGKNAAALPDAAVIQPEQRKLIASTIVQLPLPVAHRLHLPPSTGPPAFL